MDVSGLPVVNALSGSDNVVLVSGGVAKQASAAALAAALGSGSGLGPNLVAINAQSTGADEMTYWTGAGQAGLTALTAFGRSIIAAPDQKAARTALGLGDMATQSADAYAAISGVSFKGLVQTVARIDSANGSAGNTTGAFGAAQPYQRVDLTGTDAARDIIIGYGPGGKGWQTCIGKTRGADPNHFDSCRVGDRVWQLATYATTIGNKMFGHHTALYFIVDDIGVGGESGARISWRTGTGLQDNNPSPPPDYPRRAAEMPFLEANRFQQVFFFGGQGDWMTTMPPAGGDFEGIVVIGPGGWTDTNPAMRFVLKTANFTAKLIGTPIVGAVEAAGDFLYYTGSTGVRRRIRTAEMTAPAAAPGANAGTGATATIAAWGENCCTIQIMTGSAQLAAGKQATVTLPHAFPAALIPVMTAGDGNTRFVRDGYLVPGAARDLIDICCSIPLDASTPYLLHLHWSGR